MRTYTFNELSVGDMFVVDAVRMTGLRRKILQDFLWEKVTVYEARRCADDKILSGLVGCEDIRLFKILA